MKIAIIYYSKHKGNTRKLILEGSKNFDIRLIDGHISEEKDFSEYDILGLASGIYKGKFDETLLDILKNKELILPKKIFLASTSGMPFKKYHNEVKELLKKYDVQIVAEFLCNGYDKAGIFKLFGGISKNRPNKKDIENFENMLKELIKK